jgi:hypothetical protein
VASPSPKSNRAVWVQITIALIALATGGLGGAFFNAWWSNRSTVVTYTVTTTTIGTDQRVKSLLPDIKIQVGNQELPLIHTHTVELRPQSGPYSDRAEIALVFPPGVHLLSKAVTETASPLHKIGCSDLANGATCQIGPLSPGNGFFRVSFAATGTNDSPEVTIVAKGVELAKAEAVLADRGSNRLNTVLSSLGSPLGLFVLFCILSVFSWTSAIIRRSLLPPP